MTLENNHTYRQRNCYDICACHELSKIFNCSCIGIYKETSSYGHDENCDEQICFKEKQNNFNTTEECSKHCPLECASVIYNPTIQTINYIPTENDTKKIKDFEKKKNIKYVLVSTAAKTIAIDV